MKTLAAGPERLFALCLQVAFSLVVLQAFLRRDHRWLAYAIVLHFVVDFAVVVVQLAAGALFSEIVSGAFAAAALVMIARLRTGEAIESVQSSPIKDVTQAPS